MSRGSSASPRALRLGSGSCRQARPCGEMGHPQHPRAPQPEDATGSPVTGGTEPAVMASDSDKGGALITRLTASKVPPELRPAPRPRAAPASGGQGQGGWGGTKSKTPGPSSSGWWREWAQTAGSTTSRGPHPCHN